MTTEAGIRARESINRLLLSAGYFRVRMPDLEDFDKIAGGLAWCLKAGSVDVDVDIFFKEKPNVGEKVKISESICGGLRSAKCPLDLKPHQIQGLDFPSLFPVFQWLVKNVIEVRNEFGDFQRSYVEFSFKNQYSELPCDIEQNKNLYCSKLNIRQVEKFFPPKRFYKRSQWNVSLPEIKQLETTLLEYGRIPTLISTESEKPIDPKNKIKKQQEDEEKQVKRQEELKATFSTLTKESSDTTQIDGSIISSFVAAQSDEILAAQSIFDETNRNMMSSNITEEELRASHAAQVEQLQLRIKFLKSEGRKLTNELDELKLKLQNVNNSYLTAQERNIELKRIIFESQQIIENVEHTEVIVNAISLRDDNQQNIEAFEKQCRIEMAEWKEKISELQDKSSENSGLSKLLTTLDQYQKEWERKQELIAERARELLKLRSEYDNYPTMAELSQYSKRLKELSALSLQKLTELKKCQQLLNSLISSTDILEKENDLFNNVLKSFSQSINDSNLQKSLVNQLEGISTQTTSQKEKINLDLIKKKDNLQNYEEQHRKLLEIQRRYFQAVKELQEAQDELFDLMEEDEN